MPVGKVGAAEAADTLPPPQRYPFRGDHQAEGGGYFFALPGVTSTDDFLGRALLA